MNWTVAFRLENMYPLNYLCIHKALLSLKCCLANQLVENGCNAP